jgi:hypothetical protein
MKRLSHFVPHVLAQIPQIPRQLGAHDRHVVRIRKDVRPDRVRDVERLPKNITGNIRQGSGERGGYDAHRP